VIAGIADVAGVARVAFITGADWGTGRIVTGAVTRTGVVLTHGVFHARAVLIVVTGIAGADSVTAICRALCLVLFSARVGVTGVVRQFQYAQIGAWVAEPPSRTVITCRARQVLWEDTLALRVTVITRHTIRILPAQQIIPAKGFRTVCHSQRCHNHHYP